MREWRHTLLTQLPCNNVLSQVRVHLSASTKKKRTIQPPCMLRIKTALALASKSTAKRYTSMAWYCSGSTNLELVENLFKVGLIKNERVKNAMIGVSPPLRNQHWTLQEFQTTDTRDPRLIGLTMLPPGHIRTRRNPSDTVLQFQPRICMAMHANTS